MKRYFLFAIIVFLLAGAMKSDKPAYMIFDIKGKPAGYREVLEQALESDLVFFGELHNSPVCHWLELELTRDIYAEKKENLALGAEMFESDDQLILDEYLAGKMKDKTFEDEAKLWDNYKTDYKPLVLFARQEAVPFYATNVPRRYASLVNRSGFEGLDSLSEAAKAFLPPLPVAFDPDLKGYKDMVSMMGGSGDHVSPNIAKAQALKDATMAYYILQNRKRGQLLLHFNGTYHSNNFEGIIWYIRQSEPDLKIMTIASVEQDTVEVLKEENLNLADFTICIPEDMGKSY